MWVRAQQQVRVAMPALEWPLTTSPVLGRSHAAFASGGQLQGHA